MLVGLDTIAVGDLHPLENILQTQPSSEHCHIMPLDPYHAPLPCNGVVGLHQHTAKRIWNMWKVARDVEAEMADPDYQLFGRFSEMLWLRRRAPASATWDDLAPGAVRSYKVHERSSKEKLIYFHGTPKPHEMLLLDPLVKENWK